MAGVEDHLDNRLRQLPPRETHALITRVAEIDGFKGWWNGRGLTAAAVRRQLKSCIELAASASARIAGVNGQPTPPPRGLAGQSQRAATAGYADLLRAVCAGYREMNLDVALMVQCHSRMLKYSHPDRHHRGRFRTIANPAPAAWRQERFVLRPADPDRIPHLLAAATDWVNVRLAAAEFHPLLVIASFILEFFAIRPFADGNGRLSRVLTTLLLLRCDYSYVPYAPLEALIAERWAEYYFGLRQSQAGARLPQPNITPWLHSFLEVLQLQARGLRNRYTDSRTHQRLSSNQLKVLDLFAIEEEITNRLVCQELSIPRDTAKQVLNRLVALNLLARLGAGRAARYRRIPA